MEIINAKNVCKSFGTHIALNKVSLNVPEGSIYGLLGPNGAGKTTLSALLTKFLHPIAEKYSLKAKNFLLTIFQESDICPKSVDFIKK